MGQLKANKFDVEHEGENDDHQIVINNTCGFVDKAKQESIDTILRYEEAKKQGAVEKVYVTGCLSERYKGDLVRWHALKTKRQVYSQTTRIPYGVWSLSGMFDVGVET